MNKDLVTTLRQSVCLFLVAEVTTQANNKLPMKRVGFQFKVRSDRLAEYKEQHKNVWPEVLVHIKTSGIQLMELYRTGTRLFMIVEADDDFSFEAMAAKEANDPRLQEWENFMWTFQQALPWAKPGEKWVLMERIFTSKQ